MGHSNKRPSFSLIECMVALALIVLALSLVVSSSSFLSRTLIRAEVERLHMACRYLQGRALARGVEQVLQLHGHSGRYTCNHIDHQLARGVEFGVVPGIKGPPGSPTAPLKNAITFANQRIVFDQDGGVGPGTVYITDTGKRFLYALTSGVGQSPYIRAYVYADGWHQLS